jgi:hypothetical protein
MFTVEDLFALILLLATSIRILHGSKPDFEYGCESCGGYERFERQMLYDAAVWCALVALLFFS